jgi:hypothetical protein
MAKRAKRDHVLLDRAHGLYAAAGAEVLTTDLAEGPSVGWMLLLTPRFHIGVAGGTT